MYLSADLPSLGGTMPMFRLLAVSAVLLLSAACGNSTGYGGGTPPPPPPPPPPPAGGGHTTSIDVKDNQFSPTPGTVSSWATVTLTWTGSATHNVKFEDGSGNSRGQAN